VPCPSGAGQGSGRVPSLSKCGQASGRVPSTSSGGIISPYTIMNEESAGKTFKILLLNLAYCTEQNGSLLRYLIKLNRFFYLPKKVENRVLYNLKNIIATEKPDLIYLLEINKGKQIKALINEEYFFHDIKTKYGEKSILRKLPFFRRKSSAFVSKHKLTFKYHFLKNGTKKLVHEISLPGNISLLTAHFSLNKKVRAKQFKEIHELIPGTDKKIICGDFNIFGGVKELAYLLQKSGLGIAQQQATFPAFKPKKPLDLFLITKNIKAKTEVLKNQLSDHLPVTLKISL